jgi:preprotein translocase subunit SecG
MTEKDSYSAGTPRWVKVFGIIALALVVVVVVLLLTRGGHGPSRHSGDSALSGETSGHRLPLHAYTHP